MLQIVDGGCFFAEGLLILPFHFISIVYFSFFGLNTLLKIKEKFVKFLQQQNIAKLIHSPNSRISLKKIREISKACENEIIPLMP